MSCFMNREEVYLEFCTNFRKKISDILKPVTSTRYFGRQTMEDVISNIILFEINMDKKPWDLIPQKPVFVSTKNKITEDILSDGLYTDTEEFKTILTVIRDKIYEDVEYFRINDSSEDVLRGIALYTSLTEYLKHMKTN